MLADYYVSSGQMDKAKSEFSILVARYPKNVLLQKAYIRILIQLNDYTTAQTMVARLMKNSSKDPEVAALDGIVLLNDDKATEAVNALMDGAKNFPKDAFIQYWLGKAALNVKGDKRPGREEFSPGGRFESLSAECAGGAGSNRNSARRHGSAGKCR